MFRERGFVLPEAARHITPGSPPKPSPERRSMTFVAFSGDMDKLVAVLSMAASAAAMGVEVSIFFSFWGIPALRCKKRYRGKSIMHRMLNKMLPAHASRLSLSRMNMFGLGPVFFRHVMKKKNVANVHDLVATAQAVGVQLVACTMSMDVMGILPEELIDGVELGGAAACVKNVANSDSALFV